MQIYLKKDEVCFFLNLTHVICNVLRCGFWKNETGSISIRHRETKATEHFQREKGGGRDNLSNTAESK